jgi:hypothetical protein
MPTVRAFCQVVVVALPIRGPHALKVDVGVDDVTVVLALLSFLILEHDENDPLVGVANRVSERLRLTLADVPAPPRPRPI